MKLNELLKQLSNQENILSDEERLNCKIKYLNLTTDDINYIKSLPFEKPSGDYSNSKLSNINPQIISVEDIKGTLRFSGEANNWFEYMDKYVQKLRTYEFYNSNKDIFEHILIDKKHNGLPTLVKIEDSYYIKESGDGNHRVTIAKCTGKSKIAAIIYE